MRSSRKATLQQSTIKISAKFGKSRSRRKKPIDQSRQKKLTKKKADALAAADAAATKDKLDAAGAVVPANEGKATTNDGKPATPTTTKKSASAAAAAANQGDASDTESDSDGSRSDMEAANDADAANDAEDEQINNESDNENDKHSSASDNDQWDDDGPVGKKEVLLESEPTDHHEVHCPHFPSEKHEWWYVYLVEKKTRELRSMVVPCRTLDKEKEVAIKFSAPAQTGPYYLTLVIKSDSYMDTEYTRDVKIEVHAAREPIQMKYEDTDDENENEHVSDSSYEYTEASGTENEED